MGVVQRTSSSTFGTASVGAEHLVLWRLFSTGHRSDHGPDQQCAAGGGQADMPFGNSHQTVIYTRIHAGNHSSIHASMQAIASVVAPISTTLREAGERVRLAIRGSSLVSPSAAAEGAEAPEYIKRMRAMFH